MGYDYLVKKGDEMIVSVTVYNGNISTNHEYKIPVSKGNTIYYEFYIDDGELQGR